MSRFGRKHVVLVVEPGKLGFQIPDPLLKAAHLRQHPVIGTADVAE
jgi:hypothetical protein